MTGAFSKLAPGHRRRWGAVRAHDGAAATSEVLPVDIRGRVGRALACPSPTCASDLRECLHARVRVGLYGVRYVLPEDASRCVEAFNACRHGGASGGGSAIPPNSTPSAGSNSKALPQRIGIKAQYGVYDCTRSGDAANCTAIGENLPEGEDSLTIKVTGTLSGLTMTGTATGHQTGHAPANPSCRYQQELSGPATFVFNLDGTVAMRQGPFQINSTSSGSCPGPSSFTSEASEETAKWSAIT